jgi:hypothetical protein
VLPHDPGAPQPQQDLLHVVAGQTLELGDLSPGDRPFGRARARCSAQMTPYSASVVMRTSQE